jgi:transposase
MDAHEDTPRIQVLSVSDTGRRRRWTDDEKVRIIEESYRDGASLTMLRGAMTFPVRSFMTGVIGTSMDCWVVARNFCALCR